ncbi:MAG TPA: hypothetical protein VM597_30580, partial [Gemmataceae bacterium]|nr:hypothetical protein [Gemmataceae bacterium]
AAGAVIVAAGVGFHVLALGVAAVLLPLKAVLALVGFLLTPVGLVTAALVGLGAAWLTMTEGGRATAAELKVVWGEALAAIGTTFADTWGAVVALLRSGDLKGAMEVATAGMKTVWFEAMVALEKSWQEFLKNFFGAPKAVLKFNGKTIFSFADLGFPTYTPPAGPSALENRRDEAKAALDALLKAVPPAPAGAPPAAPWKSPSQLAAAARYADNVAGQFGGGLARQQFGYGDKFNEKMLKAEERAADAAEDTVKILKDMPVMAFKR